MKKEPETIKAAFDDVEIETAHDMKVKDICERIELLLDAYCKENDFQSLQDITQQQYSGGLMFVKFNLFAQDKTLLHKYTQGANNDNHITDMYDDLIVYDVCMFYIYLCTKYNKIPKPIDFSYLTGIDLDTLKRWESSESQRPRAYGTIKTLRTAYENGLENGAQSGKNALGYMAALNHRFAWSSESKTGVTINITRDKRQIMSTYGDDLLLESDHKTS